MSDPNASDDTGLRVWGWRGMGTGTPSVYCPLTARPPARPSTLGHPVGAACQGPPLTRGLTLSPWLSWATEDSAGTGQGQLQPQESQLCSVGAQGLLWSRAPHHSPERGDSEEEIALRVVLRHKCPLPVATAPTPPAPLSPARSSRVLRGPSCPVLKGLPAAGPSHRVT